jgi:hypothetical protein
MHAWAGASVPNPLYETPGQAYAALATDRDAVVSALASALAERDRARYAEALTEMDDQALINLLTAQPPAPALNALDAADMTYTPLPSPCRILDTRSYTTGGELPIDAGIAREVFSTEIASQGGDAACSTPLLGKPALVLSLSAISPDQPEPFAEMAFATLLSGAEMENGWTFEGALADGQSEYRFDDPPFNAAASILWDAQTSLTTTLSIVSSQAADPNIVLFSNGQAHYTIDVVGYFDAPVL